MKQPAKRVQDRSGMVIRLASATLLVAGLALDTAFAQPVIPSVVTWHNDQFRTGQNLEETILTPANVNATQFGKLFSYKVNGQIYAQPLYVPGVTIQGKGVHDVVYVATEADSVYAFDADNASANPTPLWYTSFTNPPNVVAVPANCANSACTIAPTQGITGTPVISTATQTIYLVARSQETSASTGKVSYYYRLHALDITSGAEKPGSPVVICGVTSPTTNCLIGAGRLNTITGNQRPGLLLLPQTGTSAGVVYIGFVNAGMVLAYDAVSLKQLATWTSVPNPEVNVLNLKVSGGIWGSGGGLAAGDAGNIFVSVGDGYWDAGTGGLNYGDSVVRLRLVAGATKGTFQLAVQDYFTPSDQACRAENDVDLGSGGPMILPQQPGPVPHELVIAGKGALICDSASPIEVVNTQNMGKLGGQVESVQGAPNGYWGSPAYWEAAAGKKFIYYAGLNFGHQGDYLRQYALVQGAIEPVASIAETPEKFGVGATPSISANGKTNGIVWAIERTQWLNASISTEPAILHAYDARNVAVELYSSTTNPTRDKAGNATKFNVPTVVNGKVYIGTQSELDVYGLLP
jgi:hypothetical protein